MMANIIIGGGLGAIPFIGDIVDGMFKFNTRNAKMLQDFLEFKYHPENFPDKVRAAEKRAKKAEKQSKKEKRSGGNVLSDDRSDNHSMEMEEAADYEYGHPTAREGNSIKYRQASTRNDRTLAAGPERQQYGGSRNQRGYAEGVPPPQPPRPR